MKLRMEIQFVLGKNGGHKLSGLGGRSIVVVREADEILAVDNSFKI